MKPDTAIDAQLAAETLVSIQNKVKAADRELIAKSLADRTNAIIANPYDGGSSRNLLGELADTGICRLPFKLSPAICSDVIAYYGDTPCYNTHVPVYSDGVARPVRESAARWNYGSYTLEQSMRAPHLIEFALSKPILDVVAGYLGCLPTLYSINTFWTFPLKKSGLTHDYHRDEDDFRFLAVFVFWTDVEKNEGEFYFIPHTQDYRSVDKIIAAERNRSRWTRILPKEVQDFDGFRRMNGGNGYANAGVYEAMFKDGISMIEGEAGTAFIADTFAIHRGSLPESRPRLSTWFRYGLYANEDYHIDKTKPVPKSIVADRIEFNEENKFICRLVVS